jgi:dihydrofolate reductase
LSAEITLVVARADNGVIGRSGGLPWRLSRDLKHYKAITMGKPIVMGRKTHESIGRPLPGRENIVVSRDPAFDAPGCLVVRDLEEALSRARSIAEETGAGEICIVGGAEIYRAMLPRARRIHLTEVHMQAEGDVTLEAFDPQVWHEISRERFNAEGDDSADFSFVVLERRG